MSIAIQAEFAKSLLETGLPSPGVIHPEGADPERRFAVYRNNVVVGLVRALEARFPVIVRLVGEEFFRAMAQVYVTQDPPRSPILFRYGSSFPDFISGFPPAGEIPYLADVARLELARGRAYHAADARSISADAFASLDADGLAVTGIRFHPSVELLTSPFPIVSIWQAHQREGEPRLDKFGAEAALVLRPDLEVDVHLLPCGGYQFLSALQQGASLARAAAIAATEMPAFHAVRNLRMLIEARAVAKLVPVRPI